MVVFVGVQWGHDMCGTWDVTSLSDFSSRFEFSSVFFRTSVVCFFPWEPENMGGQQESQNMKFLEHGWHLSPLMIWQIYIKSSRPRPFQKHFGSMEPAKIKRYLHFFLKCQKPPQACVFLNKLVSIQKGHKIPTLRWDFPLNMLRLLQLHWLSTVAFTTAASDVNDLLQIRTGAVVNYSSPKALNELAEVLILAKKECLGSSVDCISTLKQVGIFG